MPLTIGMQVPLNDPSGKTVLAKVAAVSNESVRMDINHMLAGQTLVFEIEIVETGLEPDAPGEGGCGSGGGCGSQAGGCGTQEGGCGCDCAGSC